MLIVVSASHEWQITAERGVVRLGEPCNFGGPHLWNGWSYNCQILYACKLRQLPGWSESC